MTVLPERVEQPQIHRGHALNLSTKKILRILAAWALVVTGALILTLITSQTDYMPYWCAGKLLIHHGDPYSSTNVLALEKTEGLVYDSPLIMLNPPWALFLAAPLGFFSVRAGLFLWTVATTGCVIFSAQLLTVSAKERGFAYVFAPAVAAVFMGQSSPFLLLGFALFLRFNRSRPFLAGASLLLMAIKPHLFFVFWAVLLVDCVYRHRFRIFAGGAAALVAATTFAMYFDPRVVQHYRAMLRGYRIELGILPTASMLFRMLIDVHEFRLLFVPSLAAVIWGLWFYSRKPQAWNWRVQGLLLMLVSILASPYGWFTDQVVLLPCILYVLALPAKRRNSIWMLLAINTVALVIALANRTVLTSPAYLWTPLAWLVWFLYSTWKTSASDIDSNPGGNIYASQEIGGSALQ